MNYSHLHLEETSGEHWCHHQTAIVPVVMYKKVENEVQAHSRVFMTNDLTHSNQMVQHIMDMALAAEKDADPQLTHVCAYIYVVRWLWCTAEKPMADLVADQNELQRLGHWQMQSANHWKLLPVLSREGE